MLFKLPDMFNNNERDNMNNPKKEVWLIIEKHDYSNVIVLVIELLKLHTL